ncbi:Bacterio-opsin activator HTH domain-containing protein [Halococcus thailandensis JCM 13552]|uniref:Bacterio-opsin activator HTH domain-containing protein n=1 Tax=Halococcus thailandensis JCM 13552 TaxID=1227457 RepID=M0MYA4_9EURY|nr:helix-turn-helix domain-containing protein [Halococcus thailandensis]EMA50303.1 Bacterio-opsin activator HTH domain-containing protein [Halococcus thailandensis JCM 13552]
MNGVYTFAATTTVVIDECLVVEFRVHDDDCPLADATRAAGIEIDAQPPQLRADGYALLSFTAPESERFATALDADDRIRYLHLARVDGRQNGRCLSKQPCVVHDLVSAGLIVESLRYREGSATVTGAVVGHDVLRGVLDTAGETVGVALERAYPLQTDDEGAIATRWNVTPRQEEALRAAVERGYFTVPRGATAAEVADDLDISKSAFIERLHRGQHALFSQLFA